MQHTHTQKKKMFSLVFKQSFVIKLMHISGHFPLPTSLTPHIHILETGHPIIR